MIKKTLENMTENQKIILVHTAAFVVGVIVTKTVLHVFPDLKRTSW